MHDSPPHRPCQMNSMLMTVFPVPFSPKINVQLPTGSPPSMRSSNPFMPVGVRSIASSLVGPFLDGIVANAAKLVELLLVENHLFPAVAGQFETLGQEDGFLR